MTQEESQGYEEDDEYGEQIELATEGKGRQIEACIFVQSPSWEL